MSRVSSGVSARCGRICERSSSAYSITKYRRSLSSILQRPPRNNRSKLGWESCAADSQLEICESAVAESAGENLMAAFCGPPSLYSVKKTALCSEPPRYCRKGKIPSTIWPSHCFEASVILHPRLTAELFRV